MAFSNRFGKAIPPTAAAPLQSQQESRRTETGGEFAQRNQAPLGVGKEEEEARRETIARSRAEAAKRAGAPSAPLAAGFGSGGPGSDLQDGKARSEDGQDRARRAFEEEKARKKSALERARAKGSSDRPASDSLGSSAGHAVGSSAGYPSTPAASSNPSSGSRSFGWKKPSAAEDGSSQKSGLSFGGAIRESAPPPAAQKAAAGKAAAGKHGMPGLDECQQAVSAMISRSSNGMKEGLEMLGLPNYPLVFVPGRELKLCGHDIREVVNEMIHNWMTDEQEDFYNCLQRIKYAVSKPIFNEEELEMLERKEQWERSVGPDGRALFTKRQEEESDDDEEVIDCSPDGVRLPKAEVSTGRAADPPELHATQVPSAIPRDEEDYYSLLGVHRGASLQEIRTKFRALVLSAHPEKGGDAKKFAKLNQAYGVLSDLTKRSEYDESRSRGY